jgi:glycosyltransferase involved in cell wall biosynthesis
VKRQLHYWRRWLWDFVRYNAVCGRVASHGLGLLAGLTGHPLRRLARLARAVRVSPRRRLAALLPTIEAELARLDPAALDWRALGSGPVPRPDIPKGLILKPPVSPREKGVLLITFEDQWMRVLRSGHAAAIARRYDLILGPSASPPPDLELLLMARLWPGRLFTLLSNLKDASLMRMLSRRLTPIPLLASSWVDPAPFVPHLSQSRDYDIVMLAHFDPVKRHWLFFDALRRLPRHYRVLLMGVPLGIHTEEKFWAEARAFGVQDRFDLHVRPTRDEVMAGLARGRVSLVFSRQEGSCIAVSESLFADTPVGLFGNARIGSRAFINEQTGTLLRRYRLADRLQRFVENAGAYRPREWALANISCHVSREVLNLHLRRAAEREGMPWTRDVLPFAKGLVPAYLSAETEAEMLPWYEDFARHYGLLLGPAAVPGPARDRVLQAGAQERLAA